VTALACQLALLAFAIEPPAPEPAPTGGFGTVESIHTDSENVHAPPPPPSEPSETGPRRELSGLIEAGYTNNDLGNTKRLDHHGLFLRAHFVYYPWVSKAGRIAGGLGALYAYQGLNRWKIAGMKPSKAQQQQIMLSVDMLVRPHLEQFSMHVSGMIGLGFYTNAKLLAADRAAVIRKDEYAFVAGGSLGLCSAWDIVCVTGGTQVLLGVLTVPNDTVLFGEQAIDPWGWHVGLGFDILRTFARGNRAPM
jgi:hypothetical protein